MKSLELKLPFIEQIKTSFSSFTDALGVGNSGVPKFTFSYKGQTMNIFDFSMFDKYKGFIDAIVLFTAYFFYFRKLLKAIPGLIGGFYR